MKGSSRTWKHRLPIEEADLREGKSNRHDGILLDGRCALMFAAKSNEIDAVAPFYGNLRTPPFANRNKIRLT